LKELQNVELYNNPRDLGENKVDVENDNESRKKHAKVNIFVDGLQCSCKDTLTNVLVENKENSIDLEFLQTFQIFSIDNNCHWSKENNRFVQICCGLDYNNIFLGEITSRFVFQARLNICMFQIRLHCRKCKV
jgi:hypothetical protein